MGDGSWAGLHRVTLRLPLGNGLYTNVDNAHFVPQTLPTLRAVARLHVPSSPDFEPALR